jgi:hypothetical protein
MPTVLVSGALANKPASGGEAWVRLSWVLGLQRLGCEVWFIEEVVTATPAATAWFGDVVARFGLTGRAALVDNKGIVLAGPSAGELDEAARRADLLLNISGNLRDRRLLALPGRRAYLDLDPGYTQLWHRDGALGDALELHDDHLTVALTIDALPHDGLRWRAVPPPVVLDEWPVTPPPAGPRFTTVASWRGGYGRLQDGERLYGQKAHEFRRLSELPRTTTEVTLEAALAIDPADRADRDRLLGGGWQLADPVVIAGTPDTFRDYVQGSTAELSPGQGVYVDIGCGWFSDRTTRYLASGRPAIVQKTGLPPEIPTDSGLLTFRTPDDAAAAIEAVLADYDAHARDARRLAEDKFDSDVVIGRLLGDLLP